MEHQVDMDKIIERIKKLLALANNNPNEAEAAFAMAKATEILEAYNLDLSVVGGNSNARKDEKRKGGLYSWQRSLWQAVAELNFCHYFSLKGLARGSSYEHRLIGSHANVIATEMMATYLQNAVERLAQQWAKENSYRSVFVREAIAYREGMTGRLSERLQARRQEIVDAAKIAEEERKQREARDGNASSSTGLTILNIISSEADFNNDYLQGWEMGTTAANRVADKARQEASMRAYEKQRAEKQRWREENPHLAKLEDERIAAEHAAWTEKYYKKISKARPRKNVEPRYRKATPEEERRSLGSYYEGRAQGDKVGIDTQIDAEKKARLL